MAAAPECGPHQGRLDDGADERSPRPGMAPTAAAGAAAAGLAPPAFRFWVDELLWSQGRVATVTIEEVLEQLGGQRTGGPHKPPPGSAAALGAAAAAAAGGGGISPAAASAAAAAATAALSGKHQKEPEQHHGLLQQLLQQTRLSELPRHTTKHQQAGAADANAAGPPPGTLHPSSRTSSASSLVEAAAADATTSGSEEPSSADSGGGAAGLALGPTRRQDHALLGYRHVRSWDLLWTKSVYAIRAARQLAPGQVVSAIAGLNCLSMKKRMVQTMRTALGSRAFTFVPLSFCVPEDLTAWQAWLASPAGVAADTGLWMLKTGQDAGKGLRLVHTSHALAVATRPPRHPGKPQSHIKVAQAYISRPLLLHGRKFHLRLWLLVTGHAPLRAYLHTEGLVLFASEPYNPHRPVADASAAGATSTRPASSHVTNFARNEDTWVWSLAKLADALGQEAWGRLWGRMEAASALTAAAALGPLRAAHRWLAPSIGSYGFQMLGLDFLIDDGLRPWLLEVNSAPSIMAVHSCAATQGLIRATKQRMLGDMLAMVAHRLRRGPDGSGGGARAAAPLSWREELAAEMANRGGFEPLMPLFPVQGAAGSRIPWQDADRQLQQLMQQQFGAAGGGGGGGSRSSTSGSE